MSRLSTNTGLITQDAEAKTVRVDENGQTQQKKHSTCVSCFSCFTTSSKRVTSRYTTVRQPYALGPARELRKADRVYGCRQLHNGNASAECMEENLLSEAFSGLPEHIMDAKCLRPMYSYLGVRQKISGCWYLRALHNDVSHNPTVRKRTLKPINHY